MYHKSTDFWCIGAGKQGFEEKNCSKGADIGSFYLFLNVFRAKAKCNLLFFFMYFTVG